MGRYNSNTLSSKFIKDYIGNRLWERNYSEYVPFLNVRSVPSKGKSNRIFGWKTGREHHFLSKLEYAAFYHFDWSNDVIDIKEQYPLLPIETLQNIALEAGIEYPNFNGEPIIMTTDFLIVVQKNGTKEQYVRTIKHSDDLSDPRTLEKFEIERRYFKSKNMNWGIITEKELPDTFTNNMDILHSNKFSRKQSLLETEYIFTLYRELINLLENISDRNLPIAYVLSKMTQNLKVTLSDINELFHKAIIDKIIVVDIYNKPLNINTLLLSDIDINNEVFLKTVNSIQSDIS